MTTRRGFTLLELLVTVTVVAVLSTIAVLVYRSATESTERFSAQSTLRVLTVVQQRVYSRESLFAGPARLADTEKAYTYVEGTTSSGSYTEVSVDESVTYDGLEAVAMAARQDGQCAVAVVTDATLGDPATGSYEMGPTSTCSAADALAAVGTGEWSL